MRKMVERAKIAMALKAAIKYLEKGEKNPVYDEFAMAAALRAIHEMKTLINHNHDDSIKDKPAKKPDKNSKNKSEMRV